MATRSFWPDLRVKIVADYLNGTDFSETVLWDDLDVLSTHTRIEGVEVPTEGIVVEPDDRFTAAVNLYVSLQYGNDDQEGFTTSDSFLAKIRGHFDENEPIIDEASVDTSAFYD